MKPCKISPSRLDDFIVEGFVNMSRDFDLLCCDVVDSPDAYINWSFK